ncbi:GDSL esterase/lipase At4g16230-like [Rhododendron vialii]|uniref:GDSL esterase/lipase At4g16230-like n=1 Tax=Rhododendron vialii TaxID=182163 RepID=UPI0026600EE1|nr:GDSL esterase/lipase At4g16230-like [Rhododendron vialii]
MVVFQLGPLGCWPYVLNKVKSTNNCAEDVNKLVSTFNEKLGAEVKELSEKLEGSSFVTARIFDLIRSMIQNPKDYGFQEIRWPCCATEENGTGLCIEANKFKGEVSPEVVKAMMPPGLDVDQRVAQIQFRCLDLPPLNITLPRTKDGKALAAFCPERKLYLFFDELHLTQGAYKVIANQCLNSTTSGGIGSPYGINDLVEVK